MGDICPGEMCAEVLMSLVKFDNFADIASKKSKPGFSCVGCFSTQYLDVLQQMYCCKSSAANLMRFHSMILLQN